VFRPRHIHRSLIACGIVAGLAVPGTALAQQDLRSPDARDAAIAAEQTPVPQIFTDQQRAIVERFERSPSYLASLRVAKVAGSPQPAQVRVDSGLDWGAAGIGAGGMLGLTLIALGGAVAVNHRRHRLTLTRAQ
jgi:F0F1-type ATP synthase membrane subunit c/vacuolar-type H+-ATPase subunit K